eukprot:COSAG06_NODE_516_length_14818_cov_18.077926_13_plen_88_part_00
MPDPSGVLPQYIKNISHCNAVQFNPAQHHVYKQVCRSAARIAAARIAAARIAAARIAAAHIAAGAPTQPTNTRPGDNNATQNKLLVS